MHFEICESKKGITMKTKTLIKREDKVMEHFRA
jgi:hypothetical protein